MLPRYPLELKPADIQQLIENQVEESLILDYKQELPSQKTDHKRDFLYDVAAFANAQGGDIVYGVTDRRDADGQSTGIPDRIVGLKSTNLPSERTRLENMIQDGISPPVVVRLETIDTPEGPVIVLRIPPSWAAPHMVTFDKTNKFYLRGNSRKDLMSIDQIRSAFLQKRELGDRIRKWRHHRLDLINEGNGPVPLCSETTLVIHASSADFFSEVRPPRSWTFPKQAQERVYIPARHPSRYVAYNADGLLQHSYIGKADEGLRVNDGAEAYVQIFRSGAIEYVSVAFTFMHTYPSQEQVRFLVMGQVEELLFNCFENIIENQQAFGLTSPSYLAVSLLNWKGTKPYLGPRSYSHELKTIQTARFLVPETLLERQTEESPYPSMVKPVADTIAQVCGFEASPYTDTRAFETSGCDT